MAKAKIINGEIIGVYDDLIWVLLKDLIKDVRIDRISNVEFDHGIGKWVARDLEGNVVAVDDFRNEVVKKEQEYFYHQLTKERSK
jgi:hypothetical protein